MQLPPGTPSNQTLSFGPPLNGVSYGSWVNAMVLAGVGPVSGIPFASVFNGQYYLATDSTDCMTGGGSANTLCRSTGTAWTPVGASAIGGGSDGQVYTMDSAQGTAPSFENLPYAPLPGVIDSMWSAFGTVNGAMTHTQTSLAGRVFFQVSGSNAPEVHGRTIPVSAAADFSHTIGTVVNEDSSVTGMDNGVFFTDGTQYAACAIQRTGSGYDNLDGYHSTVSNGGSTSYPVITSLNLPSGFAGSRYWQLTWKQSTHTMACNFSLDGYTWLPVWQDSAPFLTPSAIGYFSNQNYTNSFIAYQIVFGYR